jgi:hypothetical protein
MKAGSMVRVFQIILVLLVALFTMVGLTLLLSAVESTLLAKAGTSSFVFAVSARTFRIALVTLLLLSAVALIWLSRRHRR